MKWKFFTERYSYGRDIEKDKRDGRDFHLIIGCSSNKQSIVDTRRLSYTLRGPPTTR